MEQSIIKDIRKLYTKSIIWTIILAVFTVIISLIVIISIIDRPANYNEKLAHKLSSNMTSHPSKYLNQTEFNEIGESLKEEGVILNKFNPYGKLIDGDEEFRNLFQNENVVDLFNRTHFHKDYYHLVQPAVIDGQIKEIWVFSYQIKSRTSTSRYFMYGLVTITLLSPIIYFIIISRHFINKLYRSLKEPLEDLLNASNMIRNKDLEFDLKYKSKNEIGELTHSFRQMQRELKKSLYKNWRHDSEWAIIMSSLSHDLKTPATLIALSTEMLNEMN